MFTRRYTDYSVSRVSPHLSVFRLRSPDARVSTHISSARWHEVTSEQKTVQKKCKKPAAKRTGVGTGQRNPSFRDLLKERLGEVTRDEWQRSGLGFLTRFQTMKALSAASANKRKSKGNDSQHVWDKFWFNLLWLVVWNIFYFSIYW